MEECTKAMFLKESIDILKEKKLYSTNTTDAITNSLANISTLINFKTIPRIESAPKDPATILGTMKLCYVDKYNQ